MVVVEEASPTGPGGRVARDGVGGNTVAAALGGRAAALRDGNSTAHAVHDSNAGYGTAAMGSAAGARISAARDRDRAVGSPENPVGHSGQGGRHRRRRAAWTAPTGQANALS